MLLGVDGGGTKTDVAVATIDGTVVATARVGRTNHESIGIDAAVAELHLGVRRAVSDAGCSTRDIVAAVFGLAGVDWPSDERAWEQRLAAVDLPVRRLIVNDARLALAAGAPAGWGIVSCVGTGSVTTGRDRHGTWFRTMAVGWGEPCGAASLVTDALHAIAAAHHRTAPATSLTDRFLTALDAADVPTLFERISRGVGVPDGRYAPLLQEAVDVDGDVVAGELLDRSGGEHARMVVGVADHLGLLDAAVDVVTAGGVHAAGGRFTEAFAARVAAGCPGATIVPLQTPPVTGALALARELALS